MSDLVFQVKGLHKTFGRKGLLRRGRVVQALHGVGFEVAEGAALGVVGESGSGKSTLARILVGLEKPDRGTITFKGRPLGDCLREPTAFYRQVQFVFQNPYAAFNPRKRVGAILDTHLRHLTDLKAPARRDRIREIMTATQLDDGLLRRYPHSLSGGQAQRLSLARALLSRPAVVVMDEPVSALDVSVQARILRLLRDLRESFSFTLVFISHDLAVVDYLCGETIVMREGEIQERGPTAALLSQPATSYTLELLEACRSVEAGTGLSLR
ncbi:MAG: ATP-binding cassette domain-containing protein [Puniceicoccaceae bacterium]|nr:MAG: ATP-binding cassette domain-containing protein [Puniceicoccaceae bacterium]